MSTLRPCLDCGDLSDQPRCLAHRRERERNRPPRPTSLTRDAAEQRRRAAVVAAHREQHGEWCPGWRRAAHAVAPPNVLTADHVVAARHGGTVLEVLCRVCNGAKQDAEPGDGGKIQGKK